MEKGAPLRMSGEDQRSEVSQLVFANDSALVVGSEQELRSLVRECEKRKLKVNGGKANY